MTKFTKLKYHEVETKKISKFETSFYIEPLERGFANTLGNAMRRVLLSSIPGVSSFAVKIEGVAHEFQTIPGVVEDVVQLILNLKKVRFVYNESIFTPGHVIRATLKAPKGEVKASDFTLPSGVEIVNPEEYVASVSKTGSLNLELYIIVGRGFVSFEDNKAQIKALGSKIESKITSGATIAIDSDFSPVTNVSYEAVELNSSAATIEEKLVLNVRTDGSISARAAVAQAAHILLSHLEVISNVENITREEIFTEPVVVEKTSQAALIPIAQLELSARSFNCLKRAHFETLDQLSKLTKKELGQIKNLGKKSVDEIIEKLAQYNITLAEDN